MGSAWVFTESHNGLFLKVMALYQQLHLSNSFRSLSISPSLYQKSSRDGIPKQPPTPWLTYYVKSFPSYKKKFPELDAPGLAKVISTEWAKVPEVQKSRLQTLYQKEKKNYSARLAQVPQDQMDKFKASSKIKQLEKKKKLADEDLKRFLERMKKPKQPLSSYMLYCEARRPNLPDNLSPTEKVKKISMEWNGLDGQTKAVFEEKNKEMMAKYNNNLEKWNKKMDKEDRDVEIELLKKKVMQIRKDIKDQEDFIASKDG